MSVKREKVEILIVGAGFAGSATAAALARRGLRSIAILEAESIPGRHASGKNAAMARRVIADPVLAALATQSVAEIRTRTDVHGTPMLRASGGLVIGDAADIDRLQAGASEVAALRPDITRLDPAGLVARVPALAGAKASHGLYTKGCGVVDIHALLRSTLDAATQGGARLHLGHRVTEIDMTGGRISGAVVNGDLWPCDLIINAAGPWASRLGALAGADDQRLNPCRRHLYLSGPVAWDRTHWPFVWDITENCYFRPEGEGLLMCACDVTPWRPEDPPTDPAERSRLARRFSSAFPTLAQTTVATGWAGLRVLTPDDRFVIGSDPNVSGLFWVAGLGGHGMTCSSGVGEIAAHGIVEGRLPAPYATAFRPGRFAEATASNRRAQQRA